MKRQVNVAIAMPCSNGMWHSEFGMSLLLLYANFMKTPVPGYDRQQLSVLQTKTSLLPKARQELVERAIEAKATHILFIDTDQSFPSWTIHAMLSRKKPVVAANIATKSIPSKPTARNNSDLWPGGDVVYTYPDSHGIEKVWRVGTGIMLIDLSVFANIPKPWFGVDYRQYGEDKWDFLGEDWFLLEKLEKIGVEFYIDHDVSKEVGHVGTFEYTHSIIWAEEMVKEINDGEAKVPQERKAQATGA